MIINKHAVTAVLILATFGHGCSFLSKKGADFTSSEDKFSVAFPGGSDGVETGTQKGKYTGTGRTYTKSFDNRSDNFRSYGVQAYDLSADPPPASMKPRAVLELGLNGWENQPGTVVKDISVGGLTGIDTVRTIEIGPAKMTFREVVFWSDKDKKLYVIKVAATKKENVAVKEADDFVNSFTIKDGTT